MVVDSSKKPKEPEDTRTTKDKLLDEFRNESEMVCSLAYYYAKGYELGGDDVTKAWGNTVRQTDALNRAYKKGFQDALEWVQKGAK